MDLYWVRSDFRVNNNNALEQASKNREKCVGKDRMILPTINLNKKICDSHHIQILSSHTEN